MAGGNIMKLVLFTDKDHDIYLIEMKNPDCFVELPKSRVHLILDSWQTSLLLNGQKQLVLDWEQIGRLSDFWGIR
jgi:hypothetical protein